MTAPLGYFQMACNLETLIHPDNRIARLIKRAEEITLQEQEKLTRCINTTAPPPIIDHLLLRNMVYLSVKYPIYTAHTSTTGIHQ